METPPALSREESRAIDRAAIETYKISGAVLMENAGRGIADELCARGTGGRILIFCGTGNNAGDGMVIARQLIVRGISVHVFLCVSPERFHGDVLTQYVILQKMGCPMTRLFESPPEDFGRVLEPFWKKAGWVVDALLGTGGRSAPREPMGEVIRRVNASGRRILAVDLPSGLDADTGIAADPCIRADLTCTLATLKTGLIAGNAQEFAGEIVVCDIGFPMNLALVKK